MTIKAGPGPDAGSWRGSAALLSVDSVDTVVRIDHLGRRGQAGSGIGMIVGRRRLVMVNVMEVMRNLDSMIDNSMLYVS